MIAHERPGVKTIVETHGDGIRRPHIVVSFDAYYDLIDDLIVILDDAGLSNQLVGILWGADIPTRAIHLTSGIPTATLAAESYGAEYDGDRRCMTQHEGIQFARDLSKTHPGFGNDIVLIDDLTDTGRTFRDSEKWLRASPKYGPFIERIRTACLWYKQGSLFTPTFSVDKVVSIQPEDLEHPMMPWIDQPMEIRYAKNGIAGVRARVLERRRA